MLLAIIAVFGAACTALTYLLSQLHPLFAPLLFIGYSLLGAAMTFAFVLIVCARIDRSVPQESESPFHRRLANTCAHALVTLCRVRIQTQGTENLPQQGRYLLVCNHLCIADPVVLMHCFPKSQLAFISKKENDDMPIVGPIMHKLQCQLINRENDRAALRTILKCIEILKQDRANVAVFPEGYCSTDGLLHHFRPGAFKIAQKAKVPIVVCTLRGSAQVIPNIKRVRGSRVQLHLVGVVQPDTFEGKSTVEIAEHVYGMMSADLGPTLVSCDA